VCLIYPAKVPGIAKRNRQLRDGLRILWIYRQGAAKKGLSFGAILFGIAVKVPEPALIEFVGVFCL
jgi:hypothetical protein